MVLTPFFLLLGVALAAYSFYLRWRSQRSEKKLRALFAAIDYAILTLDDEGRYIEIGPTNRKVLMRPAPVLLGHYVHEFFEPEQADFFVSTIRRALRENTTIRVDYTLDIEGTLTWFNGTVSPIDGRRVVWVATDITQRKLAEEARQRAIVEQVSDIIFTMDGNGTLLSLNPAFERITGWPAEEWIGHDFLDLVPRYRRRATNARFAFVLQRDVSPLECIVIATRDGREIVLEVAVVKNVYNGETELLGSGRDITARKQAEAALRRSEQQLAESRRVDAAKKKEADRLLRESEERFRLLAQATNDAVWDLDVESGFVWRGNHYETLFGYKPGDIEPTENAWLERVHPDDRKYVDETYTTAINDGDLSWAAEYRFRRADGTYALILDRCNIVRDAEKKPTRVLGAMMDVTERKQMAEQLAQARRVSSLGRIAASIAHEFNNVLMGMEPNLEIIRRSSTPEIAKPVNHVLTSVFRGKRITEEILRFTRHVEPQLQNVAVDSLIEGWAAELAPQLGPEIALSIDIESRDARISADPYQIAQVLTNLALNARDAMPSGGMCTISVSRPPSFSTFEFGVVRSPEQFVHIQVKDTGAGISQENLAHLFEPLFTTKKHGTGLGLAISYQIVDQHGGMIFAESEAGRGTTFHILLPAIFAAAECAAIPALAPVAMLSLRRVLVVEDEQAVAEGLHDLFALEAVRVEVVGTGAEAIPAIERFNPDAIVLDIGLPDIDGSELYAKIAARWPCLPVVFSSGHADAAKLEHFLARPMVRLLVKPYSFETLHRAVADLVLSASPSPSSFPATAPPTTPPPDKSLPSAAAAI